MFNYDALWFSWNPEGGGGGSDPPLTISFPNGALVTSLWFPFVPADINVILGGELGGTDVFTVNAGFVGIVPIPVVPVVTLTGSGDATIQVYATAIPFSPLFTLGNTVMSFVTAVTASAPLSSSGGFTPNISLTVPLPIADGGTGTATPSLIAGTNVTITGSWPNQTINATGSGGGGVSAVTATAPLFSSGGSTPNLTITTPLPVADGGTGTATPSLIAGTNVTITGSWPAQTIYASGGGGGGSTAYEIAVSADSPYLWYRMADTSGSTVVDSGSGSHNGTVNGTVGLGAPSLCGDTGDLSELWYSGTTTNYIDCGAEILTGSAFTVELLVQIPIQIEVGSSAGQRFCSTGAFASSGFTFGVIPAESGLSYLFSLTAAGGTNSQSNLGLWNGALSGRHHVALTYNGTDVLVYINGVLVYTAGFTAGPYVATGNHLTIGNDVTALGTPSTTGFTGGMDEFAVYLTALSQARISAHAIAALN